MFIYLSKLLIQYLSAIQQFFTIIRFCLITGHSFFSKWENNFTIPTLGNEAKNGVFLIMPPKAISKRFIALVRWKEKLDNSRQSPLYQSDSEILKMFWHFHSNIFPHFYCLSSLTYFQNPLSWLNWWLF